MATTLAEAGASHQGEMREHCLYLYRCLVQAGFYFHCVHNNVSISVINSRY